MQHLGTLWKIASAASEVADLARSSDTYRFNVAGEVTFYLHSAHAEVRILRWTEPHIEVQANLQAPFGWRIQTDQDDAGVYFVAFRRPVVGGLAGASFTVHLPHNAYLALKLDHGRVVLDDVTGTVEIPRLSSDTQIVQQRI